MNLKDINISDYQCKGGTSKFIKKYGYEFYNDIVKKTKYIEPLNVNNKKLPARLLFLTKIKDVNILIKKNMVYDSNQGDFIQKAKNSAKKGWDNLKNKKRFIIIYDKKKAQTILSNNDKYISFLGKGNTRKLINFDYNLYVSIYKHTEFLDNKISNYNKLSHRILFLVKDYKITCDECGNELTWKLKNKELIFVCSNCKPKFPTLNWFKLKYPDNYNEEYKKYFNNIKKKKTNSLFWYINKYGEKGELLYYNRYLKLSDKLSKLKKNRYSKISQELFNTISPYLKDNDEIYYFSKNYEYIIPIPLKLKHKYNVNKNVFFVDFKYKNKIVEYNGIYWHNEYDDNIRLKILNELNYDVFYVDSNQYNRNYKPKKIINKILDFLKNAD